ncbi:MAG: CDP-diacylglycerol--glycerol-3-phosphate 3-phosphatidyltransferase [Lachnospiraceae bacterium]|nr:CDP-diacylglycerol--glycerol-3-phosphate 3-phosphatidyltransferase [Lachnospiraceae bacterium]
MNLPNKLTLLRVILIPFFIFFTLTDVAGAASPWIALGIFAVASLTDMLDGKIARKYNLITNFGKFMDPLADKLLTCSAMICYVSKNLVPNLVWVVIVIIAREFIISGFRLIAADNGVVIAASMWGKVKTVFQMIMVILMIVYQAKEYVPALDVLYIPVLVTMYIALALTVISLIDYLVKNKAVMKEQK